MLYVLGYMLAILSGIEPGLIKFVFGYLIFGAAHLSVSFCNDYFDRDSDRNSVKTAFSGGSKVLVEYPELESIALKLAVIFLGSSIVANAFFTVFYGYTVWFFVFGLMSGLLAWFYTAPPLRLAYRGLGEVSTMLAVGLLMPGMGYFVAANTIGPLFQLFILPLSCYGLFFIITVELPDVECDKISHKTNLLVKWGRTAGKVVAVLATFKGTSLMLALLFVGTAKEQINVMPFAVFSFLPLIASISGLVFQETTRTVLVRQVMVNMASMILYLFLIDASLFYQYI